MTGGCGRFDDHALDHLTGLAVGVVTGLFDVMDATGDPVRQAAAQCTVNGVQLLLGAALLHGTRDATRDGISGADAADAGREALLAALEVLS